MILAVSGGKGGVGKSTVSFNLGRELDAVVVDADLTTPDLPWSRGPDLHDVLADRASPMEAVEEIGSVEVLPCGRSLAGARAADLGALAEAVDLIDRQYGRVIIDCPAGLAADVGYQLYSADAAVIVTTPDRAALSNALKTADLAGKVESPVVGTVLNKTTAADDEVIADRVEQEFGAPTTTIEKSAPLREAQEKWLPIRAHDPEAAVVESFEELATTIENCRRQLLSTRP